MTADPASAALIWSTDVLVPLLAALIGGLIGGVASYLSAKRAAEYQGQQSTSLARSMLRLEREVEALEELIEAIVPLRSALRDQVAAFKQRPDQMSSNWDRSLLGPFRAFADRAEALTVRIGPHGTRRAIEKFIRPNGWPSRVSTAKERRDADQDQASIDAAATLTEDFEFAVLELRARLQTLFRASGEE